MELLRFEMEKCVKSMFSGLRRKEPCSHEEACSQMTDRTVGTRGSCRTEALALPHGAPDRH